MIITGDWETFWSKDYSLTKASEVEYILDPRFQPIMLALKAGNQPSRVFIGERAIARALARIDWENTAWLSHNCMPGDTEVLTPNGWVRLDALGGMAYAAQFDNGEIGFVPAVVVQKPYAGPMLLWDTQFHQGAYTPDHRVYYSTPASAEWRVVAASSIAGMSQNNTYLPVSGVRRPREIIELSEDEARLLEAVRADATITSQSIKFNLLKKRKIARLAQLCAAAAVELTLTPEGRPGVVSCYLRSCPARQRILSLLLHAEGKRLSWNLLNASVEARCAYLDELQHWDGRWQDASVKLATACAHDRDVIQAVAVCTGARSRFSTRANNRGFSAGNDDAVLHVGSVKPVSRTKLVKPPRTVDFDGMVYCLTVPSGAFVVRRNGVVWVTGNCRFDAAVLAWRFGYVPKMYLDTLSMARATTHWVIGSSSLAKISEHLDLPPKGNEVENARGKRLEDFTPAELDRYAHYCMRDNDNCREIFDKLRKNFCAEELRLIDLVIRMFVLPQIKLDPDVLASHYAEVMAEKAKLLAEVEKIDKSRFASNQQFAELLTEMGVNVPMKDSPTTGQMIPALARGDWQFKEMLVDETLPLSVQAVLAARVAVKSTIEETRTRKLWELSQTDWPCKGAGWAPVPLKYYGARPGRLAGDGGMNWQNIMRGSRIRDAIVAPEGYRIVHRDASQIEARMVSWLANCHHLTRAFSEGRDVYSEFASTIYERKVTKADTKERFVGKTAILGLGYGCGAAKFRHMLFIGNGGISVRVETDDAKDIVDRYRISYPQIPMLWREAQAGLRVMTDNDRFPASALAKSFWGRTKLKTLDKMIELPNRMKINYPDLHWNDDGEMVYHDPARKCYRRIYGAKAVENICQALARIVVTDIAVRVYEEYGYHPFLTTHDSLDYCVPESEAEAMDAELTRQFAMVPSWGIGLPLASEGGWGRTLSEAEKMVNE